MPRAPKQPTNLDALLGQIARAHLSFETLTTRKSDRLDFREVSVWGVRAALEAAYRAGQRAPVRSPDARQSLRLVPTARAHVERWRAPLEQLPVNREALVEFLDLLERDEREPQALANDEVIEYGTKAGIGTHDMNELLGAFAELRGQK